jgi:hypothetical protein
MAALLSKERIVAPPGFNRWRILPAVLGIELSIGQIQTPPDLVVKFQCLDIVDVILR